MVKDRSLMNILSVLLIVVSCTLIAMSGLYVSEVYSDPVPIYPTGDLDYDQDVDLQDFAIFMENFGTCAE